MTNKITVHDRVYLRLPGRTLVIELLDGYDHNEDYVDAWRLIDIATGEEFGRSVSLHDVIGTASAMTCEVIDDYNVQSGKFTYIEGRVPVSDYKRFKDLPLTVRLEWIKSHAQDLEHDFKLDGDTRDPIAVATKELNDIYNERPCFYFDRQDAIWMLDPDRC